MVPEMAERHGIELEALGAGSKLALRASYIKRLNTLSVS